MPVGVIPSLVVYLQNKCQWKLSAKHGKPICLFHNCILFKLTGEKPGNLVLIDFTKFLEIHVRPTLGVDPGLREAHKSLHYDSAEAKLGLLRSGECGNKEIHLATLDPKEETWIFSEDGNIGVNQGQKFWLKMQPDDTATD